MSGQPVEKAAGNVIDKDIKQYFINQINVSEQNTVLKVTDHSHDGKGNTVPHNLTVQIIDTAADADQVEGVVKGKTARKTEQKQNRNKSEISPDDPPADLNSLFQGNPPF